jgi:hypothetical protein
MLMMNEYPEDERFFSFLLLSYADVKKNETIEVIELQKRLNCEKIGFFKEFPDFD